MKSYHHLVPVSELSPNDVLCGRECRINSYPGNIQFRTIATKIKESYGSSQTNADKSKISQRVVQAIRNMDPPGRFLKEYISDHPYDDNGDFDDGEYWVEIDGFRTRTKVMQMMRKNKPDTLRKIKMTHCNSTERMSDDNSSTATYHPSQEHDHTITSISSSLRFDNKKQQEEKSIFLVEDQSHIPSSFHSPSTVIASFTAQSIYCEDQPFALPISGRRGGDQQCCTQREDEDKEGKDILERSIQSVRISICSSSIESSTRRSSATTSSSSESSILHEDDDTATNMRDSMNLSLDLKDLLKEESSQSSHRCFENYLDRREYYYQKLKNEQSIVPPSLMVDRLSSSKCADKQMTSLQRESLLNESLLSLSISRQRESLLNESLLSLSGLSIDMDAVASDIILGT